MAELIYKGAFIEDIKTEIVNLAMDGLKGTPRDRSELYGMIDRINEQPTTTESEIRAKAISKMHDKLITHFAKWQAEEGCIDTKCILSVVCEDIDEIAEQLKGE